MQAVRVLYEFGYNLKMRTKTILCVDDDDQIRDLLRAFLEMKGCEVVTASDAKSAAAAIAKKKPDLILLDLNMSTVGDPLDTLCGGNRRNPIPIILISGDSSPETVARVEKYHVQDFLPKPFSFDELEKRIAKVFQGK